MPRYSINRSTNFIVEEESWSVIEYDHTSVPGVIYLSLTEGKINSIYDDVENNIADTDKLANYQLLVPAETQSFAIGDDLTENLKFTLTKNGVPINEPVNILTTNRAIAKKQKIGDEYHVIAVGEGETELVIQLQNYPTITQHINIQVGAPPSFSGYIEGNAKINLDRKAMYSLQGTEEISGTVTYSIDDENLAKIIEFTDTTCTVQANKKNILGSIVLTASYNGQEFTKTINIIPLW